MGPSDDIGGIKEGLAMGPQKHKQAHDDNRRPVNEPGYGGPHEEVAHEELNGPNRVNHPRPEKLIENRGAVSFGRYGVV